MVRVACAYAWCVFHVYHAQNDLSRRIQKIEELAGLVLPGLVQQQTQLTQFLEEMKQCKQTMLFYQMCHIPLRVAHHIINICVSTLTCE